MKQKDVSNLQGVDSGPSVNQFQSLVTGTPATTTNTTTTAATSTSTTVTPSCSLSAQRSVGEKRSGKKMCEESSGEETSEDEDEEQTMKQMLKEFKKSIKKVGREIKSLKSDIHDKLDNLTEQMITKEDVLPIVQTAVREEADKLPEIVEKAVSNQTKAMWTKIEKLKEKTSRPDPSSHGPRLVGNRPEKRGLGLAPRPLQATKGSKMPAHIESHQIKYWTSRRSIQISPVKGDGQDERQT